MVPAPQPPQVLRADAVFAGPTLLLLLEREGFRHAKRHGAPLFLRNDLQSLTCGDNLI
jgi:hypothetical protein